MLRTGSGEDAWGAHAPPRASFGALAETIFVCLPKILGFRENATAWEQSFPEGLWREEKVRGSGGAAASTRGGCALQRLATDLRHQPE